MLTAQSSSNNSFGSYDKQELTLYKMRSDTQYFQNPAEEEPQFSCKATSIGTQPPTALMQGLTANCVSTKEQQVRLDMNHSQRKQNQAKGPSMAGHVRRMPSGICTSTSLSSNLSVRSSSSHNPARNCDRQCVVANTRCNKPTGAHNHMRYSGLGPKTAYSLPADHVFTSLAGKSPPQLSTFSHLGTFSGRSRLHRAPQNYRSTESYPKQGSNTHTSRRGPHTCPADAPEMMSPSLLYKSHAAVVDSFALSQESGVRSQRLGNKENHYCTYLHQDTPGQLHVNCQDYKKLVSKETQYSDTESLPGKLKTPLQHGKVVANVKERESSAEPTGHVSHLEGSSQVRRGAGDKGCVATAVKQKCLACHSQTASAKEVLLRRSADGDKRCERCASDSSHGGFRCDSLLKEILKAVTSKITHPAFENNVKLQTGPVGQLSKASDETMLESFAETTKTDHDTETCLVSKQLNKCANLNQTSHRHTSKSSDANSGKSALPSLGSCSQNNEPSSEQSTVSLEVKSVNLCFRCSNKKAEKNSCQQIKIKWATSPHTKSTWKAECIEVTGLPNGPTNAVTPLRETSLKIGSGEMVERNSEHNAAAKQIEKRVSTAEVAANEREKNNGAIEHANKTYKVLSPQMVFRNRAKRLLARPSETTLTSPSPCRSNYKSTSWRAAGRPRNDKSESTFFSVSETNTTTHTRGRAALGQTHEHNPHMVTTSVAADDDKYLHRRRPGAQLPVGGYQARKAELAYRHRCAAKVLARNHEDNLVPAIEDRYLLLQLDWGVFIVLAATVPVLLLLLSLNFYVRASAATRPDIS